MVCRTPKKRGRVSESQCKDRIGFFSGSSGAIVAYNCTVNGAYLGLRQYKTGTITAKNSVLMNCTIAVDGIIESTYAVTSGISFASDGYHLDATDTGAIDQGTDLSAIFTDDIDGGTRSGTWDIGCDECISATIPTWSPVVVIY